MADNPNASFLENIWLSIFTPGPTPVLLIATNAAFAALQLILALLLAFTYSVHFVVLSVLCAGLWWSINWFAKEVREVQRREMEEKERERSGEADADRTEAAGTGTGVGITEARASVRSRRNKNGLSTAGMADEVMDTGDDTETEGTYTPSAGLAASDADISSSSASAASTEDDLRSAPGITTSAPPPQTQTVQSEAGTSQTAAGSDEGAVFKTSAAARLAPEGAAVVRNRRSLADSSGDLSTDSEWEKVDDDR